MGGSLPPISIKLNDVAGTALLVTFYAQSLLLAD